MNGLSLIDRLTLGKTLSKSSKPMRDFSGLKLRMFTKFIFLTFFATPRFTMLCSGSFVLPRRLWMLFRRERIESMLFRFRMLIGV